LAEFAFNNASSSSTGISLFFANKGYHLQIQTRSLDNLLSESAKIYISNLDNIYSKLKQSLTKAQARYQIYNNALKGAKETISLAQAKDAVPGPNCMLKSLWG